MATTEPGFVLARSPDILLSPEVAFGRAERLPPEEEQISFLELPPDLAVEVLSPSETLRAVRVKVEAYLEGGVEVVWVVDPVRRSVAIYRAGNTVEMLTEDDPLDGGDVLPGFTVPVSQIFE